MSNESDGMEHGLRDVQSKISEAKYRFKTAAKYEEEPEQARVYRHQKEQLAIAMETLEEYIDAEAEQ